LIFCKKCGAEDTDAAMAKRKERGHPLLCASCRAKPVKTIKSKYGICVPHHGDFDADDNPLDEYGYYLFKGKRLCGNKDCIALDHIELDFKPTNDGNVSVGDVVERMRKDINKTEADIELFFNAIKEWEDYGKNG